MEPAKNTSADLSPKGQSRAHRIEERHSDKSAQAVRRILDQTANLAEKQSPFEKAMAQAEEDQMVARISRRILDILPPVLRGLCENAPSTALPAPGGRLVACLAGAAGQTPGAYWGPIPVAGVIGDFKLTAAVTESGFTVHIVGGTASGLGGPVHAFEDETKEDIEDGSYIFLVFRIKNPEGATVCAFDDQIYAETDYSIYEESGVSLVKVLGRVGNAYESGGYVRQSHLGAVEIAVGVNAVDVLSE